MLELDKGKELHQLVHSMDDRERRLYRKQAGQNLRNGKSHYLDLFNALAGMEAFDHFALREKLSDPALLKDLPTHQTRLFTQIVGFLVEIEDAPSIDTQLNLAHQRILVLTERGLYSSARRTLKKAQLLAQKHENYLQLLRFADLERSFFFLENAKSAEPFKEARQFRDLEFLSSLQRQVSLKMLHFEVQFATKAGSSNLIALEKIHAMVKDYVGTSVVKTINDAKATASDLLLLNVLGLISQLEGDFDRAYLAYSRMDALWVSSPEMISANANLYISFITSFLNACLAKGRYNEFRNLLSNLKTVRFEQESSAFMLQEALLYLEAVYCLNRAEYDKGIALGPEIEQLMRKHRGRIDLSRIITFYFNLCSLHFMKGQYSKANRWLTQLLQLPSQDYRRNVVQAAPVFQLLLFIAMDDRELLASRMRARLRARAGEPPSPLEAAIMAFATQFLKGNESQIQVAIAQFKQALMELMEAAPGVVPCAGECFFWAEGRLNGKLPGDMFKEYAAAQTKNGQ